MSVYSHDHCWMLVHHFQRFSVSFPRTPSSTTWRMGSMGSHRDPSRSPDGLLPCDWTVPRTKGSLLYLWLSIQLQSSLIIFNINLGSLGTGKSICKYLQDVFPTEHVDEKTGHVYRRELKIILPSLQSGGGSGARLRAGSAFATAAVGSWEIHQSWFKSDRGWHCQDTWPDGGWDWGLKTNFGVQETIWESKRYQRAKCSDRSDITCWALRTGNWLPSMFYLHLLTSHSWWWVNYS